MTTSRATTRRRPPCGPHRTPEGPCEDTGGRCRGCLAPTFKLRPEGETFGFHDRDCSLPSVHEGRCVGGGSGHPPGYIRGHWTGKDEDERAEHEWWAATRGRPDAIGGSRVHP